VSDSSLGGNADPVAKIQVGNGFDELGNFALGVAELELSRPFPKAFPDPLRILYQSEVPLEQELEMITQSF
jgi:hypothetical protein